MLGLNETKDIFGALTVGFIIELALAGVFIWIVYNKLKTKIIGSYKEREQQKSDIKKALDGAEAVPTLKTELKSSEDRIIDLCQTIQDGVNENQRILNERLDRLENRERNDLRTKILDMHRLFTSKKKNPLQAWSEMERDAFNDLIADYEELNGNGHIHTVVIPDMHKLRVIPMTDLKSLAELFHSREV
jgi:F0F1-type ATP synthase membrane subunit b/b'